MSEDPTPRVLLPSLLAGPSVLLFLMTAYWSSAFTAPIILPPDILLFGILLLPLSAVIGVAPALVATGIGSLGMIKLGNWFPLVRFPLVWGVAGGAAAWAAVDQLEFGPEWTFAYTATGAVSALICRIRLA